MIHPKDITRTSSKHIRKIGDPGRPNVRRLGRTIGTTITMIIVTITKTTNITTAKVGVWFAKCGAR
jgi:hypothetical protein